MPPQRSLDDIASEIIKTVVHVRQIDQLPESEQVEAYHRIRQETWSVIAERERRYNAA